MDISNIKIGDVYKHKGHEHVAKKFPDLTTAARRHNSMKVCRTC